MASAMYAKALISLLKGEINLETDDIRAMIVDTADETFNDADQYVSDITGAGIVARSGALQNKTLGVVSKGTFDADDITLTSVTGDSTETVIVYKYNVADSSARLIAWCEGSVTPNGNNITISWNALGIFTI